MSDLASERNLSAKVPDVLEPLLACLESPLSGVLPNITGAARPQHRAAVCALFSARTDPEILFTARSDNLQHHPSQISFPGGARDASDTGATDTALRETFEEIGLSPDRVRVMGRLPAAHVVVSRFEVVPVVAWWSGKDELTLNTSEVATIHHWPVSLLAAPDHRVMALHPSGFTGPAWMIGDAFLWGFTAAVVDRLLDLGGWSRPWNKSRLVPVPERFRRDHAG